MPKRENAPPCDRPTVADSDDEDDAEERALASILSCFIRDLMILSLSFVSG